MPLLELSEELLSLRIAPQEVDSCFGERPLQMHVPDLRTSSAELLPGRGVIALHQTTVREEDGLALSSRNAYLTTEDRQAATVLFRALSLARNAIEAGERSADALRTLLQQTLATEARLDMEYAEVVDAETFEPIEYLTGSIVIPVAGRLGATRLIDNIQLDIGALPPCDSLS